MHCCYKTYQIKVINDITCVFIDNNAGKYLNQEYDLLNKSTTRNLKINNKSTELALLEMEQQSINILDSSQEVAIIVTKGNQWLDLFLAQTTTNKHPCLNDHFSQLPYSS